MNSKIIAEQIFLAAVQSVLPDKMIRPHVFVRDTLLFMPGMQISLTNLNCIYVIGAGKATALMAKEIENILGKLITKGIVVVKYGYGCYLKHIELIEAGHPVPDSNGYEAAQKILEIAKQANNNDLIICLISGGGSALLTDFPEGLDINDIIITNNVLLRSGADIKEMNAVRKHLSKIKGGQLTNTAYPALLVSLILSDVIGDSLDAIASGPTVADTTTFGDAINVLEKYKLLDDIPRNVIEYLKKGVEGIIAETPKPGNPVFARTHNFILGSNKIALEAAHRKAVELGLDSVVITPELESDTFKITEQIIETAIKYKNDTGIKKPYCLLYGGETTLHVKGNGKGGRNQHMALYAAFLLHDKEGITFLAAGSDGSDGPTPAAGAVVNTKTMEQASSQGMDIRNYLKDFDSFNFFEKAGGHIITGATMTNVMDIIVVIIE